MPAPNHLDQWTYGYKDVATKVLHSQTMKFGFDFTRLYYLNDPIGAPNYTFYNIWDFLNDAPEAEGGPFQATTGFPGGFRNDNRQNMLGVFFQDDWKARPNLTLSAGLRYSYFGPLTDKNNNMGVLTFGSGAGLLTGITIRTGIGAWNAQKLNFGPQVGFNWSPASSNGKVVFRGGYGLNYNQEQIANANINDGNPPGTSSVPGSSQESHSDQSEYPLRDLEQSNQHLWLSAEPKHDYHVQLRRPADRRGRKPRRAARSTCPRSTRITTHSICRWI